MLIRPNTTAQPGKGRSRMGSCLGKSWPQDWSPCQISLDLAREITGSHPTAHQQLIYNRASVMGYRIENGPNLVTN